MRPSGRLIHIPRVVRRCVEFSAAESFPLEVAGLIIGTQDAFAAVVGITTYAARGNDHLTAAGDYATIAVALFGTAFVGEFHSHPVESPALSKDDRASMGNVEWIVGVRCGYKRWLFEHRVYTMINKRARVAKIVWI